jgi:hypothetical protein
VDIMQENYGLAGGINSKLDVSRYLDKIFYEVGINVSEYYF